MRIFPKKPIYEIAPEPKSRKKLYIALGALGALVLAVSLTLGFLYADYRGKLAPIDPSDDAPAVFIVEQGDSIRAIGEELEQAGLIQSSQALRWYVKLQTDGLNVQEGAYELRKNQSVPEIVDTLSSGETLRKKLTIIPAYNLFDIEKALLDEGFDQGQVATALEADYSGHPALADKPADANLEGYLYPDTYLAGYLQPPQVLIGLALDETAKVLADEELKASFERQGLTTHEAIILASIVEQEVSQPGTRKQVAQVFLRRLEIDMALGADPTFRYASELLGVPDSVSVDSPYNTRRYKGLPPGPIGAISRSSLEAVANPADGDYLYFVAGDDGKTYFSRTLSEHEANIEAHCVELCKL